MTTDSALPCANCGYDLRVQPANGICPECATPVQEAVELAAVPIRPAWRDSDPRWRRRMVAGAWVLVLVPLYTVLEHWGLAETITVTRDLWIGRTSLADSFLLMSYEHLVFVIGMVLLFSKERGRRRHRLDRTRCWGVLGSYLVFLLGFALDSLIYGLVLMGIGALFFSLPFDEQPWFTIVVADAGRLLIHYGSHADEGAFIATGTVSACLVLLASVPLYDAMRSSGPSWLAILLLAPLAASALWKLGESAIAAHRVPEITETAPLYYFNPWATAQLMSGEIPVTVYGIVATVEWLLVLTIALWLSVAQVRAWRSPAARRAADAL